MLMPKHCREVGVKDVDFPLTEEAILEEAKGKKVYFRTKFLVLRNSDSHTVVRVESEPLDVLNDVKTTEIVSLPEDTVWVEDPEADVLSPKQMVSIAQRHPGKTVIVGGAFDHVSFIKDPETKRIRVFDVVPPPSKLVTLVKKVADSQEIGVAIEIEEDLLNLDDLIPKIGTEEIVLPCKGEIGTERKVLYLSRAPEVGDATLIGCEYSKKVANALYGRELPFVQICPKRIVTDTNVPTIVKCCELQEGFEIEGKVAIVPWGARMNDIVQALGRLLASEG